MHKKVTQKPDNISTEDITKVLQFLAVKMKNLENIKQETADAKKDSVRNSQDLEKRLLTAETKLTDSRETDEVMRDYQDHLETTKRLLREC